MRVSVHHDENKDTLVIMKNGELMTSIATEVLLVDVEFKVNQEGRERMLKECKKNVHAYVEGKLLAYTLLRGDTAIMEDEFRAENNAIRVTYQPYNQSTFIVADTKHPILAASTALIARRRIWVSPQEVTPQS